MGKKKRKPLPQWQSRKENDIFSMMTKSMMTSDAFISLSPNAKILLQACYLERHNSNKKFPEGFKFPNGGTREEKETYFVMNEYKWKTEYRVFKYNDAFYKAMRELIEKGFIDCAYTGKVKKQKNVFKYSARWWNYGTPGFRVPYTVMTKKMQEDYVLKTTREMYPEVKNSKLEIENNEIVEVTENGEYKTIDLYSEMAQHCVSATL